MQNQNLEFIELSDTFSRSLRPDQQKQYDRLLVLLRDDAQQLMSTLSASLGDSYRLLDHLVVSKAALSETHAE